MTSPFNDRRTNGSYLSSRRPLPGKARRRIGSRYIGVAVLFVLLLAIGIPACQNYLEVETTVATVTHRERVCDSNSEGGSTCRYLVYTDEGTFQLTDSLYVGRFNSSDTYGRIKVGEEYRIDHYGWRIGCSSSYPNIKDMQETP